MIESSREIWRYLKKNLNRNLKNYKIANCLNLARKNINTHIFSQFEKSANYLRRRRAQENSEGNRSHFWLNARIQFRNLKKFLKSE